MHDHKHEYHLVRAIPRCSRTKTNQSQWHEWYKELGLLCAITGKTSHNDVGQAVPLRFEIVVTRKTEAENQSLHRFSSPSFRKKNLVEQMQTPEIWNWWLCLILLQLTQ